MNTNFKASGTDPSATTDSILEEELKKLQGRRWEIREENQKYLENHPEIQELLDQFISSVVVNKPSDVIKFGAQYFNDLRSGKNQGPSPIVFAGPSGVGKGTIVGILMKRFPEIFGFSVSHTTRAPRPGEENGVHYHFTDRNKMEAAIDRGEFIEYAVVHTNMYGTSFKAVQDVRSKGKICILDIDIQGVQSVKKSDLNCKYVFIMPPSVEELERRLRGRATESEEKILVRLKNANDEIEFGRSGGFDSVLVNNDLDGTVSELIKQLQIWYPEFDLY